MDIYACPVGERLRLISLFEGSEEVTIVPSELIKAPLLAFAPVPALPTGAGKKARGYA